MKQCRFLGKGNIGVCYNADSDLYECDCPVYLKTGACDKKDVQKLIKNRFCNRCNSPVYKSQIGNKENGYKYQCFKCDEDLFTFETYRHF